MNHNIYILLLSYKHMIKDRLKKAYVDYCSDKDPTGFQGMNLAGLVLDKGGEMKNISLKTDKNKEFVEIINLTPYQNIIQNQTRQKLKRIMGKLKRKGYDTLYSPDMDTSGILRCYLNARKDILKL